MPTVPTREDVDKQMSADHSETRRFVIPWEITGETVIYATDKDDAREKFWRLDPRDYAEKGDLKQYEAKEAK